MMYTKSFIRIFKLLCIAVCLAIFSGCAAHEVVHIDNDAVVNSGNERAEVTDAGPAIEEEVTELKAGVLQDTGTLYPLYTNNEQMDNILSLVFEPAIKLDSTDKPSASVIESWETSGDGREYTFHVRQNVRFHDSEETVTTDDIIFALDSIMGADESECRYSAYKGCVKTYKATDMYTFTVSLKRSSRDIFYLLNFPVFPKTVYENLSHDTLKTPTGTGGFKIKSYDASTGFELVKNEDWWRVSGNIESIKVKFYKTQNELVNAYREGEIDTLINTDLSSSSHISGTRSSIYYTTTQYYDALIPNCKSYPANVKEVRQAISCALSREDMVKQCLQGEAVKTLTPLRVDKWYMSGVDIHEDGSADKAEELLRAAGYEKTDAGKFIKGGVQLKLKLIYSDSSETGYKANVAAIIKTQLSEIGIDTETEKLSSDDFKDALNDGDFDLALCSFYTKANDDISDFIGNDAPLNYGKYDGESIDELISSARDANGDAEIKEAYMKLYNCLIENMPQIGLYYKTHSIVLPSGVSNVGLIRFRSAFTDLNTWKK